MKLCKACGETKPLDQFHRDRSKSDGLNAYCKPCQRARQLVFDKRPPRNPTPEGTKRCAICKEVKPLSEFYAEKRQYDEHSRYCKPCQTARFNAWESKNRDRRAKNARERYAANPERYKDYQRKRHHGMNAGEYDRMLIAQGGVCAICGSDKPDGHHGRAFAVDHCHATGKVRGLLCGNCNSGIGRFHDRSDFLRKAADYIDLAESASAGC